MGPIPRWDVRKKRVELVFILLWWRSHFLYIRFPKFDGPYAWTEIGLIGGKEQLSDFLFDMYNIKCDLSEDQLQLVAAENMETLISEGN